MLTISLFYFSDDGEAPEGDVNCLWRFAIESVVYNRHNKFIKKLLLLLRLIDKIKVFQY